MEGKGCHMEGKGCHMEGKGCHMEGKGVPWGAIPKEVEKNTTFGRVLVEINAIIF